MVTRNLTAPLSSPRLVVNSRFVSALDLEKTLKWLPVDGVSLYTARIFVHKVSFEQKTDPYEIISLTSLKLIFEQETDKAEIALPSGLEQGEFYLIEVEAGKFTVARQPSDSLPKIPTDALPEPLKKQAEMQLNTLLAQRSQLLQGLQDANALDSESETLQFLLSTLQQAIPAVDASDPQAVVDAFTQLGGKITSIGNTLGLYYALKPPNEIRDDLFELAQDVALAGEYLERYAIAVLGGQDTGTIIPISPVAASTVNCQAYHQQYGIRACCRIAYCKATYQPCF
jgi:hypothetical protein